MKKTLIVLLALSGIATANVTLHGQTFDNKTFPFTNAEIAKQSNYYVGVGGQGKGTCAQLKGLYVENGADWVRFNTAGAGMTITYLRLGSDITIDNSRIWGEDPKAGAQVIVWNWAADQKITMSNAEGAWVDIDADYGDKIDVSGMTTGALYLNEHGALTVSSLAQGVTLHATMTANPTADSSNTLSAIEGTKYTLVTRTLLSGTDFSEYGVMHDGAYTNIAIDGMTYNMMLPMFLEQPEYLTDNFLGTYSVSFTDNKVAVQYIVVPEPTTATLSLLALAGLAARRRRK